MKKEEKIKLEKQMNEYQEYVEKIQEQINKYKELLDNGEITKEEFETREKKFKNLFLKKLALKEIEVYGPKPGYSSIEKPWLKYYQDEEIEYDSGDVYKSVASVMTDYAKNNPDVVTSKFEMVERTAKEDIEKGDKIAKALKASGVKKGDVIAASVPCIPEFRYLFYAINKVGAVSQWLDFRTSESELIDCLDEASPKLIFTFNGVCEKVNNAVLKHNEKSENKIKKNIEIYPSDTIIESPVSKMLKLKERKEKLSKKDDRNFETYSAFLKKGKRLPDFAPVSFDKDETVAIVYTGGTTGFPKGVEFTNRNFNAIVDGYTSNYSSKYLETGDKLLMFLPPWTAYGLSMDYNAFNKGYVTEYYPKLDPATIDELILKSKPQFFAGIPKNMEIIYNSPHIKPDTDLSFIKVPAVGADSINPNLEKKVNGLFKDHGCEAEVVKGYGMTEGCATVATVDLLHNKLSSVGIPFVENNIAIKDPETGKELTYNEVGEICYSGPSVMKGYYKNNDATNRVLETGYNNQIWMHSGDLGYVDEDGYLFLVSRLKKMFVRSGFKIFSSVIEEAIGSHPAVKECVAVGVHDDLEGHIPVVNIVLNEEYNDYDLHKLMQEFDKIAENKLFEYYLPLEYAFVPTLDYTKNGKVDFMSMTKKSEEFIKVKRLERK